MDEFHLIEVWQKQALFNKLDNETETNNSQLIAFEV